MLIILTGMPGAGKSYMANQIIQDAWKSDPTKKVFTNFPVKWKNHSAMKWEPEYISENLNNSLIIIDEAYRFFNSRKFKDFSDEAHLQFATNRHNSNTFIIISQNVNRIDTVIREIAEIWWISKVAIPNRKHFFEYDHWRPLWFTIEVYDCLDSLKLKPVMGKKAILKIKRYRFRKEVAKMYDTHYFADDKEKPFESELWYHLPKEEKHGIIQFITRIFNRNPSSSTENSIPKNRWLDSVLFGPWHYLLAIIPGLPHVSETKNKQRTRNRLETDVKNDSIGMDSHHRIWSNRVYNNIIHFSKIFQRHSKPSRQRKREYDLYEPRGIFREAVFRNWMFWRPIFKKIGIEP